MRVVIVGVGALGGVIGARLVAAGVHVVFATRDARSAAALRERGLVVDGIGGAVTVAAPDVCALDALPAASCDLVVLATKAGDAFAAAPRALAAVAPGGALLPIQNGAVAQMLADRHPGAPIVGGLSNLGASAVEPGRFEQRNDGHLLVGELAGGASDRVAAMCAVLARGVRTRATANMTGAMWSKLLLNCAVTTLGAIAGTTMRDYLAHADCRALFERTYDEALAVALACRVQPERMLVEPIPPRTAAARDAWLAEVVAAYGDLKPSMLHDLERGRPTEIDYINGYVHERGLALGVATPIAAAIVDLVTAMSGGHARPGLDHLRALAARYARG